MDIQHTMSKIATKNINGKNSTKNSNMLSDSMLLVGY